ncbi:MAG: PAS domain-containing sensor histidine kinase [Bacteroidales bacterium]
MISSNVNEQALFNFFNSIFNESPIGVVITDKQGNIEYVNQTFCNVSGFSKEELIGNNPRLIKSGIHTGEYYEKMWKTILSGHSWNNIFCNRKKNGELYWEQQYIYPFVNENLEIEHFIALKIDITKQKLYEEKIIATDFFLNNILQSLPVLLFIIRPDGVFTKVLANEKSLLYVDSDLIVQRNIKEIFSPEMAEVFMQFISKTLQSGQSQCIEYSLDTPMGLRWFEARSGIVLNSSNEQSVLVIANDITERKNTDRQLKELLNTKNKFFSIIAHDLRNPIHAIMALSEMLANQTYAKENVSEIANMLYQAGKNAYELLENLLDWSRAQSGKISFNPQKQNIAELIEETTDILINQAYNKNVTIYNDIEKNLTWEVDKNILKTVVRNLVSNAIKFSSAGGFIKICVKMEADKLVLCVEDNGLGIKPEIIPTLFSLSNVTTPGTDNEKGSGLGLLLCKELVQIHGGRIYVESTPGKGSKFFVELPAT